MADAANRNNLSGKLPEVIFIFVVLAGIRPGYAAEHGIEQLRKAATQGDTSAQINLGDMYAKGEGVSKDLQEAMKWYLMAAEQGHAKCSIY